MAAGPNESLLYKVQFDMGAAYENVAKLTKAIADSKKEEAELNKIVKEGNELTADQAKRLAEVQAETRKLNAQKKSQENQIDTVNKALAAENGSYEQLLRNQQLADTQLKLMQGTLKQNADGTFELTEEYIKQSEAVKNAKDAIINFGKGVSDGRQNVGNYAQDMRQVFKESGLLTQALGPLNDKLEKAKEIYESSKQVINIFLQQNNQLNQTINQQTTVTNQATTANTAMAGGMTKSVSASKALKAALAATGIGIIVIALGALVTWLLKSQEGMNLLERASNAVGAVMNVLLDRFKMLGKAVSLVLEGKFSQAADVAKKSMKGVGDEIEREIRLTDELTKARQRLERDKIDNIATSKEAIRAEEALKNIRDNEFNSIEKRIQANDQAMKIEKERLKTLEELAQREFDIIRRQADMRGGYSKLNNEEAKAYMEAKNAIADIQEESIGRENEFITNRYQLIREQEQAREEAAKKAFEAMKERIAEELEAAQRLEESRDRLVQGIKDREEQEAAMRKARTEQVAQQAAKELELWDKFFKERTEKGVDASEEDKRRELELVEERKAAINELTENIISNYGEESIAAKAAFKLKQALAIAELKTTLPVILQKNEETGSKIAAIAPPVTVPIGTAYTLATNLLAVANIAKLVADVMGIGFSVGGYTGDGGRYQPAGIVHKGEVVFSQEDVQNHGGVEAVERLRLRKLPGYYDGGIVAQSVTAPVMQTHQISQNIANNTRYILANFPPIVAQISDINRVQENVLQAEIKADI